MDSGHLHCLKDGRWTRTMSGFAAAVLLALLAPPAQADRHVSTAGSDNPTCTNPSQPCRNIGWALSVVGTDEVIKVQTGTYFENIVINRDLLNVTIQGGYGPGGVASTTDPGATIIDGGGGAYPSSTISIPLVDQTLDFTIWNFRVTGGDAERGGGIYVRSPDSGEAYLRVRDVEFVSNRARYDGGAIYLVSGAGDDPFHLTLMDNVFTSNTCWGTTGSDPYGQGGAASVINYSDVVYLNFHGNSFTSNHASEEGGAVRVYAENSGTVWLWMSRNVVDGNTAGMNEGGGVVLRAIGTTQINANLDNNLIVNNETGIFAATDGSAVVRLDLEYDTVADNGGVGGVVTDTAYLGGGWVYVDLHNAILWDNSSVDLHVDYDSVASAEYSNIENIRVAEDPFSPGIYTDDGGNISEDPLFVDAAGGSYRLQWDSPSVDTASCAAGGADHDHEYDSRPDLLSGLCDMGFDEVSTAVLNNGEAPPNPDNVIDDDRYAGNSGLDVFNEGCMAGGACGGSQTSVEVVSGAVMGRWIRTYQTSVVTLRGGAVEGGALYASDSSRVEVVGSRFEVDGIRVPMGDLTATTGTLTGQLDSGDSFELVFYQGGYAGGYDGTVRLLAPSDAHFVNDGAINTIDDYTYQNNFVAVRNAGCTGVLDCGAPGAATQLNFPSGRTAELQIFDSSTLNLNGGYVYGSILANDTAHVALLGGQTAWDLAAFDDASVDIGQSGVGGAVGGDVFAFGTSDIAITWGSFGGALRAFDSSTITVKRGAGSRKDLYAGGSSTIEVHGYDFEVDGFDVGYGDLVAGSGQLFGYLVVNGYSNFDFERAGGTIRLVEGATTYLNAGGSIFVNDASYEFHRVYVRNQGCVGDLYYVCVSSSVGTDLQLGAGALVGSQLFVADDSTLAMSGGIVGGDLRAYHSAEIDLTGGTIQRGVRTSESSIFNMSAGSISQLAVSGSSTATLDGGSVAYGVSVDQSSALFLDGAAVSGTVSVGNSGTMTMTAGSIMGGLEFESSSSLLLEGGSVNGHLVANRGNVSITGGTVSGQLQAASFGLPVTATVTGGAIHQGVDADGPVTVELKGGEVGGILYAKGTSTIRIFGSGFAVNGTPVDPGELEATAGTLTGTLDSEDALSVNFQQGYPSGEYTGTVELVPEPVLALMQGLALLSVAVIRSRRRALG